MRNSPEYNASLQFWAKLISIYVTLDLVRDQYFKLSDDPAKLYQGFIVWCAIGLPIIAQDHIEKVPWRKRLSVYYVVAGVVWVMVTVGLQHWVASNP